MTNYDDEQTPKRGEKLHDRKNTLVVGLFGGCMGGFVLSMLLGSFNVSSVSQVPAWLQGVSGMLAVGVSVYAVHLVAKTLQATQDTLAVTRQMADDHRSLGDAQTRAWVFADGHELIYVDDELDYININIRNFGNTPAKDIRAYISQQYISHWQLFATHDPDLQPEIDNLENKVEHRTALASMQAMTLTIENPYGLLKAFHCNIDINISYETVLSPSRIKVPLRFGLTNYADGRKVKFTLA